MRIDARRWEQSGPNTPHWWYELERYEESWAATIPTITIKRPTLTTSDAPDYHAHTTAEGNQPRS